MQFLVKKYFKYVLWIVSYFALAIAYPATMPENPDNQIMTRFSNSPQNSLLSCLILSYLTLYYHWDSVLHFSSDCGFFY